MPKHKKPEPAPARHVQVTLNIPMAFAETVSDVLWNLGTLGVTQLDDETRARPYEAIENTGLATITGTFQHKRGLESRVLKALKSALDHAQTVELTWNDVEDKDWNEEWKKQWKPLQVSGNVWIVPSWEKDTFVTPDGAIALLMDPGMAFGTGTHETTQLCCQDIERIVKAVKLRSLLDVGTGSGILAMVADKLAKMAGHTIPLLHGVDIDKDSVRVARENAEANGVPLIADATPVDRMETPFQLVVANILLEPLKGMKHELKRLTAKDGFLVMSGILETQRVQLEETYTALGMKKVHHHTQGEWACVRFVHPA